MKIINSKIIVEYMRKEKYDFGYFSSLEQSLYLLNQ